MYYLIKRPLITEKNSIMAEDHNIYVFEVDRSASKTQVKDAVEKFFRVKVKSVRTSVCRDRKSRTRTRVKYWKKAMVKLAPGEKIALFEGA